ncbi:uncharacterized protein LAESUDRAFT_627923, partial [Laetiporus sulphureus 93-53]
LHHLEFINGNDPSAFGFIDPAVIVHAVHLIFAFAHGCDDGNLGPSITCQPHEHDSDWK